MPTEMKLPKFPINYQAAYPNTFECWYYFDSLWHRTYGCSTEKRIQSAFYERVDSSNVPFPPVAHQSVVEDAGD